MWPSSSSRQINYGLPTDMNNMVGVGFVVAPPEHNQDSSTISFDALGSLGNNYTTQGVGVGVNLIPLLSATPSHQQGGNNTTMACLDCGNQAKKDCGHGRCRTCCKSRGYDCTTHVKSTWIPASSRRRDKHSNSSSASKKPRLVTNCPTGTASEHTSTSNTTTPRSFDSAHQDASFKESLPEQVQAQAKFKCMRFTAIEDGEDEYAYEALVKIGGHIFKGVLYDKGIAHPKDGIPNIAELHLGGYSGGVGIGR
ncbi:hypothetical protein Leryth_019243 [Lithospermum erythrorhizon]|nr:hypothetical protein Leryth_019243 [Lithospermum erythrorhizon]